MNLKHHANDQEFLTRYLAAYNFIHGTNPKDISYIKDSDFNYRSCSPSFVNLLNSDTDQIIGANDYQLNYFKPCRQIVENIWQQELQLYTERNSGKFLYVTPDRNTYIVHKSVIINPTSDNVIGIHGYLSKFVVPHPINTLCQINEEDKPFVATQISEYEQIRHKLTERRHMILFFCLHRYSAAETAEILTTVGYPISVQRVNDHINKLKYMFMVKSKDQLIDKAISLNFQRYFPRKLLKVGSYHLDDNIDMLISDHGG